MCGALVRLPPPPPRDRGGEVQPNARRAVDGGTVGAVSPRRSRATAALDVWTWTRYLRFFNDGRVIYALMHHPPTDFVKRSALLYAQLLSSSPASAEGAAAASGGGSGSSGGGETPSSVHVGR